MIYRGSFLFSWKTWETAEMLTNSQTCLLNSSILEYSPRLCLLTVTSRVFKYTFPLPEEDLELAQLAGAVVENYNLNWK